MKPLILTALAFVSAIATSWIVTSAAIGLFCGGYQPGWFCSGHGGGWLVVAILSVFVSFPAYAYLMLYKNRNHGD